MKFRWKDIKYALIFLAVAMLFSFGTDLLRPIMQQSALFHGVMAAAGVLSLPLFTLILRIENDPRPFPPAARYPQILMRLFFYSLSLGMIFWGLGFWFPLPRLIAYGLVGIAVACALVLVVLILRADRANAKAKKQGESQSR